MKVCVRLCLFAFVCVCLRMLVYASVRLYFLVNV